jgi:hypothetical protein
MIISWAARTTSRSTGKPRTWWRSSSKVAGAWPVAAQGVVRVHELAGAQRQAAAADAAGEAVAQPLELIDPLVEISTPLRGQARPVAPRSAHWRGAGPGFG